VELSSGKKVPFAKSMGWLMDAAGSMEVSLPRGLIITTIRAKVAPRKIASRL
jgi:hypothetical protein